MCLKFQLITRSTPETALLDLCPKQLASEVERAWRRTTSTYDTVLAEGNRGHSINRSAAPATRSTLPMNVVPCPTSLPFTQQVGRSASSIERANFDFALNAIRAI
jgi:hypothetical protein